MIDVSEEYNASSFRVEDQAKQEIGMKQQHNYLRYIPGNKILKNFDFG
jgi:hypothetical protein